MSGLGALGALAGAADSASGILGANIKLDLEMRMNDQKAAIENRLRDADELRKQRAAEWQAQFNKTRAGQIDAESQGILATKRAQDIPAKFGGQTAAEFDAEGGSLPSERAMVEPSATDRAGARADAARKLGMLDFAREEDANYKNLVGEKRADNLEEAAKRRDEESTRHNKAMETYNADKIQAMLTNGELRRQIESMKHDNDIPPQQKAMVKAYADSLENISKDMALSPEEKTKAIDALTAQYSQRIPPQVDDQRPDGKVAVRDFLGVTHIYPDKEAAAKALGLIKKTAPPAPVKESPKATVPPEPYRSTGQSVFGMLSDEKMVRQEAAAGNQKAIEYLRVLEQRRADEEERRNTDPNYGRGY